MTEVARRVRQYLLEESRGGEHAGLWLTAPLRARRVKRGPLKLPVYLVDDIFPPRRAARRAQP